VLSGDSNVGTGPYWEEYERKPQRERGIYLESFLNKVGAFIDEPMIRNIFGQSKTTLDFRHIMDTGKILLVKLSPEYEEASRLVAATILSKILLAAFSRSAVPEHKRRQFSLYCDEFQRYASSDMATLISEARKFKIATTLAHQTLSQLDEANRTAAAAAGNLIVFRVSGEDGKTLAPSFDSTPQQVVIGFESERASVSDVISHLIKRGHNDPRVVRFAQVYLQNLEDLIHKITQYEYCRVYSNSVLSHMKNSVKLQVAEYF
jgi:predicted CopG family antitoxin